MISISGTELISASELLRSFEFVGVAKRKLRFSTAALLVRRLIALGSPGRETAVDAFCAWRELSTLAAHKENFLVAESLESLGYFTVV